MAKGTKANGDTYTLAELADPEPPVRIRRAELGRVDQPCQTETDGEGSSASSEVPSKSKPSTESASPSPAQPVENPSEQKETEGKEPTAPLTGGDTQKTATESPRKPPPRSRKSTKPSGRSTQARASAIGPDDFE